MRPRLLQATLLGAVALLEGCIGRFDPSLFMRDAGLDGDSTPADAGPRDNSAIDGGPPPFALSDYCNDPPELVVAEASRTITIDTRGLADDGSRDIATCLGRAPNGPDAFFRIAANANERWHFHYRHVGAVDPALYILGTCDLRVCMDNQAVDLCDASADEHLTFQPSAAGTYIVGIDAYGEEGLTGSLEVYRPTCGNGAREHSETCDDGDLEPGDGCDEQCRDEITSELTNRAELEVNDDFFSANHVLYTPGTPLIVTGRIATSCESDWFVVDLASPSSLTTQLLADAEQSCAGRSDLPDPFTLELIAADGQTRLVRGALVDGCPRVESSMLERGRYFLRVFGGVEGGRRFDYALRLTVTPG